MRRFPLVSAAFAATMIVVAFVWFTERGSDERDLTADDRSGVTDDVAATSTSAVEATTVPTTTAAPTTTAVSTPTTSTPQSRQATTTAPPAPTPPPSLPALSFTPPPPPSPSPPPSPAGGHVSPGGIGARVGPGAEPGAIYAGPLEITEPGTVIDGMVVQGCLRIRADSVTIRNSVINCAHQFSVEARNVSGLTVQRTRIACSGGEWAAFHMDDVQFTLDGLEVTNCGDPLYAIGALGSSSFTNSVMWRGVLESGSHYDAIQIGSSGYATGSLLVAGNWMAADGPGCCYNAAVFISEGSIDVTVRNNWIDGGYGFYPVRCYSDSRCRVEGNVAGGTLDSFVLAASNVPVVARCNVLENGTPVPPEAFVSDGGSVTIEPC